MSAKRNPFNENVNRLMDKIFSDRKPSHTPQKTYQDEPLVQKNDGILHDTQPGKKHAGEGQMKNGRRAAQGGKVADGNMPTDFLALSLLDLRRTTEKIRETTKQMQQMTLQMWEETARGRGEEKSMYGEERIPPRAALPGSRKVGKAPAAGKNADRNPSQGVGAPVHRTFTPQYRAEEILDHSVPERIRECRAFARSPQGYRMTKEELFFRQAKMMEDYEDDCLYPGEFTWYFPTYQAMNVAQLRGYFTWRAQLRQGNFTPAPLSFAFVYVYELLHQIGAGTPEEGFLRLKAFWEKYREYDTQLDRYMQNWLCDYVVYYGLDCGLLGDLQDVAFDHAMLIFLHPEEGKEEEYFAAICALSKYNMVGSKFYKEYQEDVRKVACGVFRALSAYYEKHGKKTLAEKYFGTLTTCACQMFASAVFYDHKRYAEYEYVINPLHRYRCVNGRWSCEKYFGARTKNKDMGLILHAIDARMRERYEYKASLKLEGMTKLVMNFIEKEIDRLLEEKRKDMLPVIEIDVTKLSGIRRAAELTKERLIVEGSEEDTGADFAVVDMHPEAGAGHPGRTDMHPEAGTGHPGRVETVPEAGAGHPGRTETVPEAGTGHPGRTDMHPETGAGFTGKADGGGSEQLEFVWESGGVTEGMQNAVLNEEERTLLRCLLDGAPYEEFLREHRLMLSVVVDAINGKLFDRFGDTVIVFDADTPEVLEDYAKEAAVILAKG